MSEYQTYDHECGWFRSDNRREPYFSTPDDEAFARAEAFGAIRRAAEVAREWDAEAADTYLDLSHGGSGWTEFETVAHELRRAIRAAIGSDKT